MRAGLLPLLEQRGLVIREHSDRAVVIRCPNAESHTTGSDGDGSSIFYLPKAGGDGAIHCLHSGCRDLTLPEWRGMLGIATITRWARIVKSHVNVEADGAILIVVELAPVDGGAELPWLRADSRSPRRWDSLWDAADLETPDPAKPAEVAIQARGLQDAILALEVESGKVRRIFAAAVAA